MSPAIQSVQTVENPGEVISRRRQEIEELDRYWAVKEKEYAEGQGAGSQARWEAGQIRQLLHGLILPRLDWVSGLPPINQAVFLNLMVPFDTDGGIRDFLLHFCQVDVINGNQLEVVERDPYEREVYILHDLYKAKKTLDVISTLRRSLTEKDREFPSRFSKAEQEKILTSLEGVLNLLFTQILPPHHRHELISNLSPDHLTVESVAKRRKDGVLYAYPHVLKKYDYRRFFFLIYFKEGFRAKMGEEERDFRYNFLNFQLLKKEFLIHWMTRGLKNNPQKYSHYARYIIRNKSLLAHIVENPEKEGELLMELAAPQFNDLVAQVNEELPQGEKLEVEAESQTYGLFGRLKEQVVQTVKSIRQQPQAAVAPAPKPSAPVAPVGAAAPGEKPKEWRVVLLTHEQIANPFFTNNTSAFTSGLNILRVRMGESYGNFRDYVTQTLENSPETAQVRRRTPKHEWTLPYLIIHDTPKGPVYYLVVLGAEAKTKPRGMGYQSKESYDLTPYFVFAASQPEDGFGEAVGDRVAGGHTLREYSFQTGGVVRKVLDLLSHIKQKDKR
ncbi:MAG: hypothetical protein OEV94_04555 [Deltaproteobacteria bacterium]|nr:hypothetical protein [Deltaproteobacteria bacterium]